MQSTQVTHWQGNLGEVETILKFMLTVQRAWASLEAIFLTSEDIKTQLPEDTRRCGGDKKLKLESVPGNAIPIGSREDTYFSLIPTRVDEIVGTHEVTSCFLEGYWGVEKGI